MPLRSYEPSSFVETGGRLKADFAMIQLLSIIAYSREVSAEPFDCGLEQIAATVQDLRTRVVALDGTQQLQRTRITELGDQVNLTAARCLEDHDEVANRRNEHKIVVHGLPRLSFPDRVQLKTAAYKTVESLFEKLFGAGRGDTLVQVRTVVYSGGRYVRRL